MTTIINRNASIPVKQSEVFSTGADFQDTVEIHVLQGERPFAKDNKSLGIFKLNGIPSAPRGVPKINVTFQLDVNGLLSVSAREEQSGQEQSIKIEGASVLERDEVSKMIKEAEENADLDKSKKALVNITYELDNLLSKHQALEKVLEQNSSGNRIVLDYSKEVIKEIKSLYKTNELTKIGFETLDSLKYAYNVSIIESFKSQLSGSNPQNTNSASGNTEGQVIDVTEE